MAHRSLRGQLLIASPGLMDPNFVRTVVLVAEHSEEGALGLILNRPTTLEVAELWKTLKSVDKPPIASHAFLGGPVQSQSAVLLLHAFDDLADGKEPVVPGVYLGSDVELFGRLVERGSLDPDDQERFRVFCGYSGWGAGQLDAEMKAGGWLTAPATHEAVFQSDAAALWAQSLASLGGIYQLLAQMPPHPELN